MILVKSIKTELCSYAVFFYLVLLHFLIAATEFLILYNLACLLPICKWVINVSVDLQKLLKALLMFKQDFMQLL